VTALIVYLDTFGREALDRLAMRGGGSRGGAVRTAALYYLGDAEAGRAAWQVPSFASAEQHRKGVRVRLDEVTRRALAEEAERQGVRPGALAAHAVLYFAADLDSGRLGDRLEEALQAANQP
jgi:hypothetical protein